MIAQATRGKDAPSCSLSLSLSGMVQEIHGTYQVQYHPVDDDPDKVESGYRGMQGVFLDLPPPHMHIHRCLR